MWPLPVVSSASTTLPAGSRRVSPSLVSTSQAHIFLRARARESMPPSSVTFRDTAVARCRGLLANLGPVAPEDHLVGARNYH
jgi:hypothetical protein